ncbi:MurG UDP-N-acetylglucosamine,LPS N-acetylglucosamine transferase [Burkholderiaceae bacterium]
MRKNIELVYFNAGGGHRAAALALREVIEQKHPKWDVSLVNLFEVIDSERYFQKLTGFAPEDLYNLRLKKGWTRGLATELKIFQAMIRLTHVKLKNKIEKYWKERQPDLVVSLIPNFNKVMYESLRDACPGVPYVTVLTDLADYPPNFWIEPNQEQSLICGTDRAAFQAVEAGYRETQITQVSGMIMRPSFYQTEKIDRKARYEELGLAPHLPTGLVMFGGHGSTQMVKIAKDLSHRQMIFVCGHNELLAQKIKALKPSVKHVVYGFTSEISLLMQLSDYFIGKPGPGSLSESIHMGLPVITFKNASTMPQERFNTQWVIDHQYGLVISTMRELPGAVEKMIAELSVFKAHVAATHNRAVFEVVEALDRIIHPKSHSLL